MAITKTSYAERVLIVLNPDGSFKGAHEERLETIADGAEVLQVKMLSPAPVAAGTLASVLPNQAALAAQVQSLTDALAAMTTARDAAVTAKTEAETAKAAAEASQAGAEAARDAALAEKQDALTAQAAAEAEIATAHAARDAALAAQATAEARVAELEAQIAPVDANGFAVLTPRQIRLGLIGGGVLPEQVDAMITQAIADPTQRAVAMVEWHYATAYHREHALITTLGGAMGLTSDQVDQMWAAAAQL